MTEAERVVVTRHGADGRIAEFVKLPISVPEADRICKRAVSEIAFERSRLEAVQRTRQQLDQKQLENEQIRLRLQKQKDEAIRARAKRTQKLEEKLQRLKARIAQMDAARIGLEAGRCVGRAAIAIVLERRAEFPSGAKATVEVPSLERACCEGINQTRDRHERPQHEIFASSFERAFWAGVRSTIDDHNSRTE